MFMIHRDIGVGSHGTRVTAIMVQGTELGSNKRSVSDFKHKVRSPYRDLSKNSTFKNLNNLIRSLRGN